jgi:hypothetical protein
MANLFLTPNCGRGCAFCFAKQGPWAPDYEARELSLAEVARFLECGDDSIRTQCGIIGGEPLTHKAFCQVVRMFRDKGVHAKVFTSGSCPCPDHLEELVADDSLHFVVNVSPWDTYVETRQKHLHEFLSKFGRQCSLSYTLSTSQPDGRFLIDYIEKYGLIRHVRVGVALPMVGGGNEFIAPSEFRATALRFLALARHAFELHISLGTDCGFVACMFSEEEIGELQWMGAEMAFTCGPVIDVGPDLEAWYCFPLARIMRLKMGEPAGDGATPVEAFRRASEALRRRFGAGVYERCSMCDYRERGLCAGGCLGHIIPSVEEGVAALADGAWSGMPAGAVECRT